MSNIYEITNDYLQIMAMLEDSDLDPQTLADTMEGIEGEFEIKAENYAKVMKNLEGDILAIKTEIDRLTAKKKALENNIKNMKSTLQTAMETTGKTKFKTELFSFNIQKTAPAVVIDLEDMSKLPSQFIKQRDIEADKTAIKDAIQKGEDLGGIAHLEIKNTLRIK